MKFDPGHFYIGVVDFFSIMLPGGILAFFLYGIEGQQVFGYLLPAIRGEAEGWVVFLLASYLFGHIVFLVGSRLDDMYAPIRRLIWSKETDVAYLRALAIKQKYVVEDKGSEVINTFQWAKAVLVLQHPGGMVEVARLEADSKFFRSLVIVVLFMSVISLIQGQHRLGALLIVLLMLAFWRYVERRYKSTQQAYWYVVTLESLNKLK